jgi:hypothetical protein
MEDDLPECPEFSEFSWSVSGFNSKCTHVHYIVQGLSRVSGVFPESSKLLWHHIYIASYCFSGVSGVF